MNNKINNATKALKSPQGTNYLPAGDLSAVNYELMGCRYSMKYHTFRDRV